jgi:hypothetical protein
VASKKRRAYLHVGCRKSGTTALQAAIRASTDVLAEQGLRLPFVGRRSDFYEDVLTPLTSFADDEDVPPRVHEALAGMTSTMAATAGSRLLLTIERLAELDARRAGLLVDALDDFEVHIIITARDWARQIPSEWQQDVKGRALLPYADFVEAVRNRTSDAERFYARQDVPAIAARWGAHLPPDQVHVVAVPQESDARRLLELFGQVIGIDASSLQLVGDRTNPSLGYEQAETLRRINVALGDRLVDLRRDYRHAVKNFVYHGTLSKQEGMPLRLPPDMVEWCHEVSAAQAKELVASGYDLVGSVPDLISPTHPATTDYGEVTDAQVAEVAVHALADLAVLRHEEVRGAATARKPSRPSTKTARPDASGAAERIGRRIDRMVRRLRRRGGEP